MEQEYPVFASCVFMVEPTHFFLNEETFTDNKFMTKVEIERGESTKRAIGEFHALADAIRTQGIEVVTYKQQAPELPDSVFPNNWFSTHRSADIPGKQARSDGRRRTLHPVPHEGGEQREREEP